MLLGVGEDSQAENKAGQVVCLIFPGWWGSCKGTLSKLYCRTKLGDHKQFYQVCEKEVPVCRFHLLRPSAEDPKHSAAIQYQQLRTMRPAVFKKSLLRPLLSKSISHPGLFSAFWGDSRLRLVFPFTTTIAGIPAPTALWGYNKNYDLPRIRLAARKRTRSFVGTDRHRGMFKLKTFHHSPKYILACHGD